MIWKSLLIGLFKSLVLITSVSCIVFRATK